jgi:hypothetical protein
MKTIIHHGFSRRWLGVGMSLVAAIAAQAQTAVTYSVDMSTETLGTPTAVYVTGTPSGMGWAEFPAAFTLTNTSGTIWSGTFIDTNPVGTVESVKFNDDLTGWEPSANREFLLGTTGTVGPGTEVLPLALWNSASTWPTPTNYVTFQVDMSAQVLLGNFTNGDPNGSILVAGDSFPNTWGNGDYVMTNNPTLSGNASNIYSGTFPVVDFVPAEIQYKFRMNGGWESLAPSTPQIGGNRFANITTSSTVLPLVYYSDNSIYDLVLSPITVTFSLTMTNGTLDDSGYAFNPGGGDTLWINGDFLNNWDGGSWPGPVGSLPSNQQMIEVGTSGVYTNSFVIPRGNSIYLNYKYSIDSEDDENGFATNHVREIRSYGPTYTMPQDVWSWTVLQPGNGNSYPNPGIASTNIVEPDFGYLAIVAPSGGNVPITWLGRPGVVLENNSSLTGGIWTTNSGTDGTQSTNWPNAGSSQFFRLLKKQ